MCNLVFKLILNGTESLLKNKYIKEAEGPTLHNSMDGTGEHYAKWNKPGSERLISYEYDLTYKWNLINKMNQASKI